MKNLFLFLFFVAYASFAIAQDNDSTSVKRKNVIKFLPVNIPFQSNSFEFERMINAKNSFTLGIGLANQQSLIGKYGIDASSDLKKAELGTSHIRVAFRHYGGGKRNLPRGFYIEPYVKYQKITGSASGSFTDDQNNTYPAAIDVNVNTMNVGFQLGAQFLIAKRVTLDFYFLGLEAGFLSGNVTGTAPNETFATDLYTQMKKSKNDLPASIGDKIDITQSGNQVNIKASSVLYPWLRSGISIGIAF
jgi:hypothetical protein